MFLNKNTTVGGGRRETAGVCAGGCWLAPVGGGGCPNTETLWTLPSRGSTWPGLTQGWEYIPAVQSATPARVRSEADGREACLPGAKLPHSPGAVPCQNRGGREPEQHSPGLPGGFPAFAWAGGPVASPGSLALGAWRVPSRRAFSPLSASEGARRGGRLPAAGARASSDAFRRRRVRSFEEVRFYSSVRLRLKRSFALIRRLRLRIKPA